MLFTCQGSEDLVKAGFEMSSLELTHGENWGTKQGTLRGPCKGWRQVAWDFGTAVRSDREESGEDCEGVVLILASRL